MIAYKDIEEEEKEEESKKNQRWFSRPTSENALAQSRIIVALSPSIVVDGLSTTFSEEASRPAFAFHAACSTQLHFFHLIISLTFR